MRLRILFATTALLLAGCQAKSLSDAGSQIATVSQVPRGCTRLGDVAGRSGGWISGDVTAPRDLELGARNDLRNQAAERGADTVQIVSRDGVDDRTFAGHGGKNEVRYEGVAWRCASP
jgi:hypothetical protein